MDKIEKAIEKIFSDGEKAEFLEFVKEKLPGCRRAVICFEIPREEDNTLTEFNYAQLGFKMTYELLGFLGCLEEIVHDAEED